MSNHKLTDEENPWTTKGSRIVYDNPWIKVREDQVIDPSGNDTIYGVVSAKHLAVGILPLDEDLNTWLIGQYRYPLGKYSWEILEGGGQFGVDPIESGKRELKEEAGIIAAKWTPIMTIHTSNCIADETAYLYLAQELTFTEAEPDENEKLQLVKVTFHEAYNFVLNGTITDAMSVAAILRTKILLDEGLI